MGYTRTRILQAITRTAPKDRILGPGHIEHIATAVLDELGDDLIDDDTVPDEDEVSVHTGVGSYIWCQYCDEDTMFCLSSYASLGDRIVRVGEMRLCSECGYSPYQEEGTQ